MAQGDVRHTTRALPGTAPPGSRIARHLPGADFWDAWTVTLPMHAAPPAVPVLDLYLGLARRTPAWIDACMALRNRAVRRVGLKDLGRLSDVSPGRTAVDYRCGERVGIFTLIEHNPDEVLLGDRDRHLDVVVSLHREQHRSAAASTLTVTTVVHLHNRLGWLYMLPVRPMHRLIARAMTSALARPPAPVPGR